MDSETVRHAAVFVFRRDSKIQGFQAVLGASLAWSLVTLDRLRTVPTDEICPAGLTMRETMNGLKSKTGTFKAYENLKYKTVACSGLTVSIRFLLG